jgi:hypothetical protein
MSLSGFINTVCMSNFLCICSIGIRSNVSVIGATAACIYVLEEEVLFLLLTVNGFMIHFEHLHSNRTYNGAPQLLNEY